MRCIQSQDTSREEDQALIVSPCCESSPQSLMRAVVGGVFSYGLSFSKLLTSGAVLALLLVQTTPCNAALSASSTDQSQAIALDSRVRAVIADPTTGPLPNSSTKSQTSPPPTYREPRFSVGVRGGLSLGEHDLKLTTNRFPNYYAGAHGQFRMGESHFLRPVGEWWNFRTGVQRFQNPTQIQTINTQVRAMVAGGEYLYLLGGPFKRTSLGFGGYVGAVVRG